MDFGIFIHDRRKIRILHLLQILLVLNSYFRNLSKWFYPFSWQYFLVNTKIQLDNTNSFGPLGPKSPLNSKYVHSFIHSINAKFWLLSLYILSHRMAFIQKSFLILATSSWNFLSICIHKPYLFTFQHQLFL